MNVSVIETAKQIRLNVLNSCLNPNEFNEFKDEYPKFYEMLKTKNMNEDMFNKLIEIISNNSTSNQNAASEFSKFGAEKYVYPTFGKPSEKDINNAKKKINKLY